jgi:hypothetical protein
MMSRDRHVIDDLDRYALHMGLTNNRRSVDSYISVDDQYNNPEPMTPDAYTSALTPRSYDDNINTPPYIAKRNEFLLQRNNTINDPALDFGLEDRHIQISVEDLLNDDIPMLDHEFNRFNLNLDRDPVIDQDGEVVYDRTTTIRYFYRLEFFATMVYSIMAANNVILVSRMTDNTLARYIIKITLDHISLLGVTYAATTVATYRSISLTLGYIVINAGIFNYRFKTIITYIVLDLIASVLGNLIIGGIYYTYMTTISDDDLIRAVSPSSASSTIQTYSFLMLNALINITFLAVSTVIISTASSIECKTMVYKKIFLAYLINLLFMHHGSGVNNGLFTYSFRIAHSILEWSLDIFNYNRLIVSFTSLVIWASISPFLVKIFNNKFKIYYTRYIEY